MSLFVFESFVSTKKDTAVSVFIPRELDNIVRTHYCLLSEIVLILRKQIVVGFPIRGCFHSRCNFSFLPGLVRVVLVIKPLL